MRPIIKSVDTPKQVFKGGEILFNERDTSNGFYIVKKGTVVVYKDYGKSTQVTLATIGANQVLGEIAAFDGLTRTATAVAGEPVEVVRVSAETLAYQMKQAPAWFRAIILDLVERLRRTNDLLTQKGVTANSNSVSSQKETGQETQAGGSEGSEGAPGA